MPINPAVMRRALADLSTQVIRRALADQPDADVGALIVIARLEQDEHPGFTVAATGVPGDQDLPIADEYIVEILRDVLGDTWASLPPRPGSG